MALHASRIRDMISQRNFDIFLHNFRKEMLCEYGYLATLGDFYYLSLDHASPQPNKLAAGVTRQHSRRTGRHTFDLEQLYQADLVSWNGRERRGIILDPQQSVLTHTLEFVGARTPYYATAQPLQCWQLNGVVVECLAQHVPCCSVARLPLVLTNTTSRSVFLECGAEVVQLQFFHSEPTNSTRHLSRDQTYSNESIAVAMSAWTPRALVDRLFDFRLENPAVSNLRSADSSSPALSDPVQTQRETTDIICNLMNVSVDRIVEQKLRELLSSSTLLSQPQPQPLPSSYYQQHQPQPASSLANSNNNDVGIDSSYEQFRDQIRRSKEQYVSLDEPTQQPEQEQQQPPQLNAHLEQYPARRKKRGESYMVQ